jgi:hypothetical protein
MSLLRLWCTHRPPSALRIPSDVPLSNTLSLCNHSARIDIPPVPHPCFSCSPHWPYVTSRDLVPSSSLCHSEPPSLPIAQAIAIVRLLPSLLRLLLPSRLPPSFLSAMDENPFPFVPIALHLPCANGSTGPYLLPFRPSLLRVSTRPVLDTCPLPPSPYRRCNVNLRLF